MEYFLIVLRKIKKLPDEFYNFWNTEKKSLIEEINSEDIINVINDIEEMLFFKNIKNTNKINKNRFFTSKPSLDYYNLFKKTSRSSKNLPDFNGCNTSFCSLQIYDNYSLKSQYSQLEEEFISIFTSCQYTEEKEVEGSNIIHNNKKELMYISLDLLIYKIAFDKQYEINDNLNDTISGFIHQYTSFISTEILLLKINNAVNFYLSKRKVIAFNLIAFMNLIVIKNFVKEIQFNIILKNNLLDIYQSFIKIKDINDKFCDVFNDIIVLLESDDEEEISSTLLSLSNRKKRTVFISRTTKRNSTQNVVLNPMSNVLMDWNAKDIAKELTYITSSLINRIEDSELLYRNFNNENKKIRAPNVVSVIERFDKVSYFVIEEILSYDKKKLRAKMIEKFILVADELDALRNFNDCMNIKSCLTHFIIRNLHKTWKLVGQEYKNIVSKLNRKYSFDKNFSSLREHIEQCKKNNLSYIPYFGLVLKDIAFNEEGHKYTNEKRLINIQKIKNIKNIIDSFFAFKQNSLFVRHIYGLEILNELNPKSEKELETISNCLEPIFTLAKKKITVKRMTRTDITMINKNKNCFFINTPLCRSKKNSYDTEDTSLRYDEEDDGYDGDSDNVSKLSFKNRLSDRKSKFFLLKSDRKETK